MGYLPVAENASGRWRLDLESLIFLKFVHQLDVSD